MCFCFFYSASFFSTQLEDAEYNYNISGVTLDSTATEGQIWETDTGERLLASDTPPPCSEDSQPPSIFFSPPLSPADQALARLNQSASSDPSSQRESPPMDTRDLRYQIYFCFF